MGRLKWRVEVIDRARKPEPRLIPDGVKLGGGEESERHPGAGGNEERGKMGRHEPDKRASIPTEH